MLIIQYPISCVNIIEFLCKNVFTNYLGTDYKTKPHDDIGQIVIGLENSTHKLILKSSSILIKDPFRLQSYDFIESPIQLLYANNKAPLLLNVDYFKPVLKGNTVLISENSIETDIDIFGLIFFMLSRVEELDRSKLDIHGRFAATSSKAYQHGFLERPIVDEYVEFLWTLMKYLWPNLERKEKKGEIIVGCDVDVPYDCSSKNLTLLARPLLGDIFKRFDINSAFNRIKRFISYRLKDEIDSKLDLSYSFDWYMDVVEKAGLKATFFIIADSSDGRSGCYSLSENKIKILIKKILDRGHDIGLHGSYDSYNNRKKLIKEKLVLQNTITELGYDYLVVKTRQHYLRWDAKTTPDCLEAANLRVDYSGGYADHNGFRYGTSKPFNAWSWDKKKIINLQIQPLVLMDTTVFEKNYQNLPYDETSINYFKSIKHRASNYGGNFCFLWHNDNFKNSLDRDIFINLLDFKNK